LDRQVGRLFALEYPPGVDTGEAIRVGEASPITDEPAGDGKLAQIIHRRYGIASRQFYQLIAPIEEELIAAEDDCIDALLNDTQTDIL
jgi:hypothetical protein